MNVRWLSFGVWILLATSLAVGAQPPSDPPGLKRLDPRFPVWLDPVRRRIVMVGEVCLQQGQLEMFACLRGTKEHESIVSLPAEALDVHAALIALGAQPGNPAHWVPEYQPASGAQIDVSLYWTDEQGKRRSAAAQDWIRDMRTGKPLDQPWVFGGSGFWVDEGGTGQRHYQAEQGDFICVSNFPTAMLDLPIESSAEAGALGYEAFTERIPPLGTKVTVVLTPRPAVPAVPADTPAETPASE